MRLHPDHYRHGSARFAGPREIRHAGYYKRGTNSIFIGFDPRGRPMFWNGAGGVLLVAGARSGKLRDVLAYSLCWSFTGSMILVDPKGEMASISQDQTLIGKLIWYWNPYRMHDMPAHRVHFTSNLHKDNPYLESDIKTLCRNILPDSGSANSSYFEQRARAVLKAIIMTLIERDGVLHLSALFDAVQSMLIGDSEWGYFAWEMHHAMQKEIRAVEAEIQGSRKESGNGGGIKGILGEVAKAIDWMSDEKVRASVSPPYDVTIDEMMASKTPFHFVMMPPGESLDNFVEAMRLINTSFYLAKARNPGGQPITMCIDEAAKFGKAPFIVDAFSIGAGLGIRPLAVYQSLAQMKATGPNAETIIPASAAVQLYFGIRELPTAQTLSQMLGKEQRYYNDTLRQFQARRAQQMAMDHIMRGGDMLATMHELGYQRRLATHQESMARDMMMPNEIMGMGDNEMLIFGDGLRYPIHGRRAPYYEQRFMARRYTPNPYHPPCDKVRVKAFFGHKWLPVRTEAVPARYAHLPQYAEGTWTHVER